MKRYLSFGIVILILLSGVTTRSISSLGNHIDQLVISDSDIFDPVNETLVVVITSDEDFISQGWQGNGSSVNPFIIENLRIESGRNCIRVENTRSYFTIRNCSIWQRYEDVNPDPNLEGIFLQNVTNGLITNCTIESSTKSGVLISRSNHCNLTSNIIRYLFYPRGFAFPVGYAALLEYSNSCIVMNNIGISFDYGFKANLCNDCLIVDNLIYDDNWTDFVLDIFGPSIIHEIKEDYHISNPLSIEYYKFSVIIQDENNISCAIFYYRISENDNYSSVTLESGSNFTEACVQLTPEDPRNVDIWYYYWANDTLGNWRKTPVDTLSVNVYTPSIFIPPPHNYTTTSIQVMQPIEIVTGLSLLVVIGCCIVIIIKKSHEERLSTTD